MIYSVCLFKVLFFTNNFDEIDQLELMAYLQDNHRTKSNDIHYTAVIPSTINGKGPSRQDSPLPQKQTELERAKAVSKVRRLKP